MTGVLDVASCLLVAVVLGALGVWGRANARQLIPGGLPEEERDHREAVLRRGALAAQFVALLFVVAGVGLMVS